ncbi:hypothetical protein E5Q_06696 [Mixia osmundae IAM 14324]|uniref:WDR5-like beta-propeller domain-containing protein n=1 Tax=Mixia osmundae (strain CBS 9802 / IAM 14324 / JCM 22182 / KY 12970) TaxID=764103 RepID=G7EAY3_MIXOS|nr:hypothetical protein E5Q_06696 [Mixia osmundae IAM 14324]
MSSAERSPKRLRVDPDPIQPVQVNGRPDEASTTPQSTTTNGDAHQGVQPPPLTNGHQAGDTHDLDRQTKLAQAGDAQFELVYTFTGHQKGVCAVSFSPSGQLLASAGADGLALIFDVSTGHFLRALRDGHTAGLNDLSWSPCSRFLATASDDATVRVWTVETALCDAILTGHTSYIGCVAYNPQGNLLASGSFDETVIIWDVLAARALRTLAAHSDPVSAVDFIRDGSLLLTCSHDGFLRLWDTETGQCLKTLVDDTNPPASFARFSPNGKVILACSLDSTIRLWSYHDDKCLKSYTGHTNAKFACTATFFLASDGRQCVLCGSEDGTIWSWDVTSTAKVGQLVAHTDTVTSIAVRTKTIQSTATADCLHQAPSTRQV